MTERVLEYKLGAAATLAPFQGSVAQLDIEANASSTEGDSSRQTVTDSMFEDGLQKKPSSSAMTGTESMQVTADAQEAAKKHILLCMPGRGSEELKSVCVAGSKTDQCMFAKLNASLCSIERRLINWVTFRRLVGVNFTKLTPSL